jgi:hypothetical protein
MDKCQDVSGQLCKFVPEGNVTGQLWMLEMP